MRPETRRRQRGSRSLPLLATSVAAAHFLGVFLSEGRRVAFIVVGALLDLNLLHLVDLLLARHLLGSIVRSLVPEGGVLLAESLGLL